MNIKVTRIKNRWHARLLDDDKILDEMVCEQKQDIGWVCREMLRWYSKNGGISKFAEAARDRHVKPCTGKVWYRNQLLEER
jgi:hypothetical protein